MSHRFLQNLSLSPKLFSYVIHLVFDNAPVPPKDCPILSATLNRGQSVEKKVKWAGILNRYQRLGLSSDRPEEAPGGPTQSPTVLRLRTD